MNFDEAFRPMEALIEQAVIVAPRVAMVLLVLLLGLLVAAAAGRITRWLVRRSGLETLSERIGAPKLLYTLGLKRGIAWLLGTTVWGVVILLTLTSAAELLGLPGVAQLTSAAVSILPRFLLAGLIAVVGLVAADLLRTIVRGASRGSEVDSPEVVAQIAYYAVVIITVTTALEQAGIETTLINNLVQIVVALVGVGFAVAFALSSKIAFQNVVARHYVRKIIRPGDRIGWNTVEGEIVRYGPASVLVRTDKGEVLIPCRHLLDEVVVLERP